MVRHRLVGARVPTRSARSRALVSLVIVALVAGPAAPAGANVAYPVLQVSQSCLTLGQPAELTIWGSAMAPGDHAITDSGFDLPPNLTGHADANGNFSVSVMLTPTAPDAGKYDTFSAAGASVYSRIDTGSPGCPVNQPSVDSCANPGRIQVSSTGVLDSAGGPYATADWYLDYRGRGTDPQPFATTTVDQSPQDGGQPVTVSAVLNADNAPPGGRLSITVVLVGRYHDAYVTFPVNICRPAGTTTTVAPTTTTTTMGPTTTTTRPTTTTTTIAPTTTTTTTTTTVPRPTTTTTTTTTTAAPVTTTTPTTVRPPGKPALTVTPDVGPDGIVTVVHGSGFSPGTEVTLEWQPGIGTTTVGVGADGSFNAGLLVLFHDQLGPRQVHAQGFGPGVSAHFLVEAGTAVPSHGGAALVIRH